MAVRGRVVRVAADEPEAADLDPGVLARGLDTPATVKAARLCRRERDRYAHLVRGLVGFSSGSSGAASKVLWAKTGHGTCPCLILIHTKFERKY